MAYFILFLFGMAGVAGLWWARVRFSGFQAQRPTDYATGPIFDIRDRLNGPLTCEGMIYGPFGRVTSRFTAEFDARWEGNICHMTEVFHYDSGNLQHRRWTLTLRETGEIHAEAPDLIGSGRGRQAGSGVQLTYIIKLTEEAGGHTLAVNDWMYLMPNGTILNRSQFRKFGITVAELIATMRPRDATDHTGE